MSEIFKLPIIFNGMIGLGIFVWVVFTQFDRLKSLFKRRAKRKIDNHPFFSEIENKIMFEVPKIKTGNTAKDEDAKTLLTLKLRKIQARLMEYGHNIESGVKYTSFDIQTLFMNCLDEYEREALANGVCPHFVEAFGKWHSSRVEAIYSEIKTIWESDIYSNDMERLWAECNMFMFILEITISDAKSTLNSLNGSVLQWHLDNGRKVKFY